MRTMSAPLLALFLSAPAAYGVCDPTLTLVEIDVKNMAFTPSDLEICLGQTVRWTNSEDPNATTVIRHTVTANPAHSRVIGNVILPEGAEMFESAAMLPGDAYEHTFTVLGQYQYVCRPHEMMGHIGKLTVVDPTIAPVEPVE